MFDRYVIAQEKKATIVGVMATQKGAFPTSLIFGATIKLIPL